MKHRWGWVFDFLAGMMRVIFLRLFLLAAFGFSLPAVGQTSSSILVSNSITYQTINNTTNFGAASIVGTATVSGRQIVAQIQNGGLTPMSSTNALLGWFQISFDNANWTTVQIYQPASTNATIDSVPISANKFTVYGRVVLVTTNSVNAGASIQLIPFVP
jgi:hypothetical protein